MGQNFLVFIRMEILKPIETDYSMLRRYWERYVRLTERESFSWFPMEMNRW